ncbi:pseudouridine synthase family protein [Hyphomonas neptunium ATCC 15444]|uniref:Pseudouridine synthase family protein n=2 Tax=Hyphomonas TaxID=85 RepID=Q0BYW5_HYPNA|nr:MULTISPECIES: RluA family pseudouridine synthase [Hyphomonas]ABI76083.1 pseudouridine synthase family protein [Hyphomonas neptunium ATCC 15444]KCZ91453.1 pseudouridine synthase family protein [Hyphomonas hirschiana VP5]
MTRNRDIPALSPEAAALARSLLIHEDAAILGFNKPPGMASQGGSSVGQSLDDLLWAFAKSNGKRPRLVHRLDQGTSGVMLTARTQPAAAFLSAAFAGRDAQKTYLALVKGKLPPAEHGVIDASLVKVEEGGRPRMILAKPSRKGAQPARTGWAVLARNEDHALMQLTPETGRMHQIRVHLMSLGCPILGDGLYGEGQATAPRVMLHAARLEVPHPEGGTLTLEAPVPEDFRAAAEKAGLQAGLK